MRIKEALKNQDMFGKPVSLNFDKKGDVINTNFGGVISLIIKIGMFAYFINKYVIMKTHGNDKIVTNQEFTDFDGLDYVNLAEAQIMPFFSLKSSRNFQNLILEDMDKYFSVQITS